MTAVTIQSNQIVSNEVEDNRVLLEPSYGKTEYILAKPVFLTPSPIKALFLLPQLRLCLWFQQCGTEGTGYGTHSILLPFLVVLLCRGWEGERKGVDAVLSQLLVEKAAALIFIAHASFPL